MTPGQITAGVVIVGAFLAGAWLGRMAANADRDAERAQQAKALVQAVEAARADEGKLRDAVEESAARARDEVVQLRIARAGADAESVRLRKRIAALVASGRAAPAGGGDAAGDPIGVLADVLGRADERSGIVADYADRARVAGLACQRAYEALTPK